MRARFWILGILWSAASFAAAQKHKATPLASQPDGAHEQREPARPKSTVDPVALGARKAMAVLYQSCSAIQLRSYSTAKDSSLKGVSRIGTHEDGTGGVRVVSNADAAAASHYYISKIRDRDPACFGGVDLKKQPPIYDYGGKPSSAGGQLNFFKNVGSGSPALGVDCSGFVFTALAASGMRLVENQDIAPAQVFNTPASAYAGANGKTGLSCFAPVQLTSQDLIRSGDVIANRGHVAIIDSVGADPFGIANVKSIEDCQVGKMLPSKFNFTLIQSAPVGGGLGVSRMQASDYLTTYQSFNALRQVAASACKAKFQPEHSYAARDAKGCTIVRHKDSAACRGAKVPLKYESCLKDCAEIQI